MKQIIIIFNILILLFGCTSNNKNYNLLLGDWKNDKQVTFCFEDSICTYLTPTCNFVGYKIIDDTVICNSNNYDQREIKFRKFKIVSIDSSKLILVDLKIDEKTDTIKLFKIQPYLSSELLIDSLLISSSNVLSKYPTVNLLITKNNFEYEGINNVTKLGKYKGSISNKIYQNLLRKFRYIDLHDSVRYRGSSGCYGPYFYMKLVVSNEKLKFRKALLFWYEIDLIEQPIEVLNFVNFSLNLYKNAKLEKTDSLFNVSKYF